MTVKENILEHLKNNHAGADNALLGRRLCTDFGISTSLLRQIVGELRSENHPICSDKNGYFYAQKPEELDEIIAHLSRRSADIQRALEGLVRARSIYGNAGTNTGESA